MARLISPLAGVVVAVVVVLGAATTMIVLMVKRSILHPLLRLRSLDGEGSILVAEDITNKAINLIRTTLKIPDFLHEVKIPQQMDRLPQYRRDPIRIMHQAMVEVALICHITNDHKDLIHRSHNTPSLERTRWYRLSILTG